jgi:anti-sigma B factor antagonist
MSTDEDAGPVRGRGIGTLGLRSTREGETHIVELLGELDIAGAPQLEAELLAVEATDAEAIVVDLSSLEFIDSTGIRMLLMAADRCSDARRMTILRGPKQVHRVFEITDLVSRLPFADE